MADRKPPRGLLGPFRRPVFADPDLESRARLGMSVVRAVTLAVLLVVGLALLDPVNAVTGIALLYGPVLLLLTVGAALLHRGYIRLVGWGVAILVWATVTVVLLFFGGLNGHNAMAFVVAMTIAATVAGGRAALGIGVLSILSAGVALLLEVTGRLPESRAPVTAYNSFVAVTATMLLAGWLVALSLRNLQRALNAERAAARERDLANAAALRSQRLESVGRLSAGVAHDLNNMLSVVNVTAAELRSLADGNPSLLPIVDDLSAAANQATLLSRRLVGMSRAGGTPAEPLELGDVAANFAASLRRLLPPDLTLRVDVQEPVKILASRSAVEHILLNLVLNARDSLSGAGAIDILVGQRSLSVRDNGAGMTPEVQAKLFTPFFTTRAGGTGLGLANVTDLCGSIGAKVSVASEVGKGSTFTVTFPPG